MRPADADRRCGKHLPLATCETAGQHAYAALAPELSNILGWIEQLQEVDVAGVEPMTAVIPNRLRLRDDVVNDGNIRDDVLANAPDAQHGFFAVPKVIE